MAIIYISLGSNIDADKHIRAGLQALFEHFGELQLSRVFESEAVGFDGDNFLNMVASAETEKSVAEVVALFKNIEQDNGRDNSAPRFSGRTLDIDLLLYGDLVCQQPIELPRDEIEHNAFVLWPLSELAPEMVHPHLQKNYQQLWQAYDKSQQLWPIEFSWKPQ
ncbi:2-amino-4-hydroxy-6-hydroxymethyldihydropteridine diphosphokinase [Paraferrimonas sp. SM1919]|uniref:2-amino-4-hydroxy-6- hydroxymethyldihydropteridine diphosphokinase n=1 Tax=Paraferrimonas sp. SM1919 TaxID=2662263 RepID=UPI0013D7A413|nr:2-amino-4-hydroxy-6-hydroxymethyldihydropteridine diphosphokinase [Paraferrimonas sp. SM1919]